MLASFGGHLNVARFLIENQVDMNSFSDGGWTSLHSASQHGHADVMQLLLDNGVDVNVRKKISGLRSISPQLMDILKLWNC